MTELGFGFMALTPEGRHAPRNRRGNSTGRGNTNTLWKNSITIAGVSLVIVAVLCLLTIGIFSLFMPANPYRDVAGYLVVPSILVFGVFIIPMGILFKNWRMRRQNPGQRLTLRFPRIDLNDPNQRRGAKLIVAAIFILIPVLGVSGYHGFHYTDSTSFCAKACHAPMHPQATAYEHSPHARVSCAECHVGSGATWFVKSKLAGTRQVLATLTDNFERPISSTITELRPAR